MPKRVPSILFLARSFNFLLHGFLLSEVVDAIEEREMLAFQLLRLVGVFLVHLEFLGGDHGVEFVLLVSELLHTFLFLADDLGFHFLNFRHQIAKFLVEFGLFDFMLLIFD